MRLYLSLLLIVLGVLASFISQTKPASAASADWQDMGYIKINNVEYWDKNPYDDIHIYAKDNKGGCVDRIAANPNEPAKAQFFDLKKSEDGSCFIEKNGRKQQINPDNLVYSPDAFSAFGQELTMGKTGRSKANGAYIDGGKNRIQAYLPDGKTSEAEQPYSIFRRYKEGDVQRSLNLDTYYLDAGNGLDKSAKIELDNLHNGEICNTVLAGTTPIPSCQPLHLLDSPPQTGLAAGSNFEADKTENEVDCDAGFGFTFVVCAMIDFTKGVVNWVKVNVMDPFLTISPLRSSQPNEKVVAFEVWKELRNLANILLIPVFIFIIYSQAVGGGRE